MWLAKLDDEVFIKAARGAGVLSIQSVVNSLLGLAFFMFFARVISKTEMGVYGAAFLVLSILVIVGNLGLVFTASRFPSYYQGRSEPYIILAVSKKILLLSLTSGMVLLAASFLLSKNLSLLLLGTFSYTLLFKIVAVAVFVNVVGLTLEIRLA